MTTILYLSMIYAKNHYLLLSEGRTSCVVFGMDLKEIKLKAPKSKTVLKHEMDALKLPENILAFGKNAIETKKEGSAV